MHYVLQELIHVLKAIKRFCGQLRCIWYFLGYQRSYTYSKHVAWNETVSDVKVKSSEIFFINKNSNFRNKFSHTRVVVLRYLRLTPSLVFTILLMQLLSIVVRDRPLCAEVYCEKNWWTAILHIQNYVNPEKMVRMWKFKLFEWGIIKIYYFSACFTLIICRLICKWRLSPYVWCTWQPGLKANFCT